MTRVLFVCTGNTCRSPMAEAYFRHLLELDGRKDIVVSSAGTFAGAGESASSWAVRALQVYGIELSGHRSTPLSEDLIMSADLIVVMTDSHRRQIGAIRPQALAKTRLLASFSGVSGEIGDPFGGSEAAYADCFESMKGSIERLFSRIDEYSNHKEEDG